MAAIRSVAHFQFLRGLFANGSFYRAGVVVDAERSTFLGSFFNNRRLHSQSQADADNGETHEYEKEKMSAEGGANPVGSFKEKAEEVKGKTEEKAGEVKGKTEEKAGEVKGKTEEKAGEVKGKTEEKAGELKGKTEEKAGEVKEKAEEVKDEAKGQVSKNADTAKEMFSDFPQKVSETAAGLKDVGVEAGKAIKRDATKVVEKAGLKSE